VAANDKIKKHDAACSLAGMRFTPFSADTCGMIDENAAELLKFIASRQARHSGRSYSDVMSSCRKKISFALQLGVARQLLAVVKSEEEANSGIVGSVVVDSSVGSRGRRIGEVMWWV